MIHSEIDAIFVPSFLTKDKYLFTESVQNVFPFPTYFVNKCDDNYVDDHSLSVQSVSTGGHFKSPSCSPTHTPIAQSNAGTPAAETPVISPYVSPKGSPNRKHSIYDIFCAKTFINPHICMEKTEVKSIAIRDIPEVRVHESTPVNSQESDSLNNYGQRPRSRSGTRNGKEYSSSSPTANNQRTLSFVSNLAETTNSDLIVSDKSLNASNSGQMAADKTKKKKRKRFLLFFCFGSAKNKSSRIKVKPKPDSTVENVSNKKCIKDNVNNSIEDYAISGRQLDSCADRVIQPARQPSSDRSSLNYKERRRKSHIMCCFLC